MCRYVLMTYLQQLVVIFSSKKNWVRLHIKSAMNPHRENQLE